MSKTVEKNDEHVKEHRKQVRKEARQELKEQTKHAVKEAALDILKGWAEDGKLGVRDWESGIDTFAENMKGSGKLIFKAIFNSPEWWRTDIPGLEDMPIPAYNPNRSFAAETLDEFYDLEPLNGSQFPLSRVAVNVNDPLRAGLYDLVATKMIQEVRTVLGTNMPYDADMIKEFLSDCYYLSFCLAMCLKATKSAFVFNGDYPHLNQVLRSKVRDPYATGLGTVGTDPELSDQDIQTMMVKWDVLKAALSTIPMPSKYVEFASWLCGVYYYDDSSANPMLYTIDVKKVFSFDGAYDVVYSIDEVTELALEMNRKYSIFMADMLAFSDYLRPLDLMDWSSVSSGTFKKMYDYEWFDMIQNAYTQDPNADLEVFRADFCDKVIGGPAMAPALLGCGSMFDEESEYWLISTISQSILTYAVAGTHLENPSYLQIIPGSAGGPPIDTDVIVSDATAGVWAYTIRSNAGELTRAVVSGNSIVESGPVNLYCDRSYTIPDGTLYEDIQEVLVYPQKILFPINASTNAVEPAVINSLARYIWSGTNAPIQLEIKSAANSGYVTIASITPDSYVEYDSITGVKAINPKTTMGYNITLASPINTEAIFNYFRASDNVKKYVSFDNCPGFRVTASYSYNADTNFIEYECRDLGLAHIIASQCEYHIPLLYSSDHIISGTVGGAKFFNQGTVLIKEINNPVMISKTDIQMLFRQMVTALAYHPWAWHRRGGKDKK